MAKGGLQEAWAAGAAGAAGLCSITQAGLAQASGDNTAHSLGSRPAWNTEGGDLGSESRMWEPRFSCPWQPLLMASLEEADSPHGGQRPGPITVSAPRHRRGASENAFELHTVLLRCILCLLHFTGEHVEA